MLRTIIWFTYFWLYLLVCIPASLWVIALEKRGETEKADRLTRKFVHNWAARLLWMAGARVTVEGADNLPDGPAVYIGNHQGYFDIPLMLACVGEPRGLMAKKEIDRLPGIRTWMRRLHRLFVDRPPAAAGARPARAGGAAPRRIRGRTSPRPSLTPSIPRSARQGSTSRRSAVST